MILPSSLKNKTEWVFVGPMGPSIPSIFQDRPVICVDGGAHFSEKIDIWVGDADSFEKKVECDHLFKFPKEKDKSDLALAFELFSQSHHFKFHLWGFLGGRKDHELFNLGESLSFLESHHQSEILFYDETGKISYQLLGSGQWRLLHSGPFSLGTHKKISLELTGSCLYRMERKNILNPLSSFGLSNHADGEMILNNDGPIFLYYPEGK